MRVHIEHWVTASSERCIAGNTPLSYVFFYGLQQDRQAYLGGGAMGRTLIPEAASQPASQLEPSAQIARPRRPVFLAKRHTKIALHTAEYISQIIMRLSHRHATSQFERSYPTYTKPGPPG